MKQRATGRIFAMKVMRKDKVLAKNHSEYMRQERDILTDIDHPFIVKMHYSFQVRNECVDWWQPEPNSSLLSLRCECGSAYGPIARWV